jgi:hypothetical protein
VSATVITEESFMADALATAVMVKGRQEGIAMLGRFPGARAVFVERDGTIWVAEDLKDVLELAPLPSRNAVRFYGTPVSFLSRPPQNAHLRRTNNVRLVMTWTPAFAGASFVRLAPGRF